VIANGMMMKGCLLVSNIVLRTKVFAQNQFSFELSNSRINRLKLSVIALYDSLNFMKSNYASN
jgi:hypothetical protein